MKTIKAKIGTWARNDIVGADRDGIATILYAAGISDPVVKFVDHDGAIYNSIIEWLTDGGIDVRINEEFQRI